MLFRSILLFSCHGPAPPLCGTAWHCRQAKYCCVRYYVTVLGACWPPAAVPSWPPPWSWRPRPSSASTRHCEALQARQILLCVLRIHDIFARIRIRGYAALQTLCTVLCNSVADPLTFWYGSGSCYFQHRPPRCQVSKFLSCFRDEVHR